MAGIYSFFETGQATESKTILSNACKACLLTKRAQIGINSKLKNHLNSVHDKDEFWVKFKEENNLKKDVVAPAVSFIIL